MKLAVMLFPFFGGFAKSELTVKPKSLKRYGNTVGIKSRIDYLRIGRVGAISETSVARNR